LDFALAVGGERDWQRARDHRLQRGERLVCLRPTRPALVSVVMLPGRLVMLRVEQRLAQECEDAHQRRRIASSEAAPGTECDVERDGIFDDQLFGRRVAQVDERALALIDAFARRYERGRDARAALLVEGLRRDLKLIRSHQFGALTAG